MMTKNLVTLPGYQITELIYDGVRSLGVHLKYVCMGIPLILNTCRDAIYRVSTNMRCTRSLVYRGTRSSDNQSVIIKVLRNEYPTFNELLGFRNQYAIAHNLAHPNIIHPLALERYGNGYALIMADVGAISLSDYWFQSKRSVKEFCHQAIQLTEALHYLIQQRIIHKDIKP